MIPVNEPLLKGNELQYVTDCLSSGWISSAGKYIDGFEKHWAAYCGMKHGIAVSNGTVALQVAARCIGLKPGDEVIMPTFTIISCALAVIECGAVPVLVDSDPNTWTLDVNKIEDKITPRTKAIMAVHIYGHPCDMDKIWKLANKYKLKVIEDAAEAHGAEYNGKRCGGLGDISCFSFYANKIITTGEGGMILTDDDNYAEKARSLRNLCFKPERRFYHTELGYNYRLTNMQAAIGLAQVEQIDSLLAKKRQIGRFYAEKLKGVTGITLQAVEPWANPVYWMYGIVLDEKIGIDAAEFAKRLREKGIDTRPFFLGMHEQPVFHEMGLFNMEHYPVAERIARQGLYLPSGSALTEDELYQVANAVKEIL